MWHMADGWGWWMVMGWVWMVAFWGLVIWAVYALISRTGGSDKQRTNADAGADASALEIAARRYARGELSADEFEQMRERIAQAGGGSRTTNGASTSPSGTSAV